MKVGVFRIFGNFLLSLKVDHWSNFRDTFWGTPTFPIRLYKSKLHPDSTTMVHLIQHDFPARVQVRCQDSPAIWLLPKL